MNYYNFSPMKKRGIIVPGKKRRSRWLRQLYAREQLSIYDIQIKREDFPWQEQYERYLLQERCLVPITVKGHIHVLRQFFRFLQQQYSMQTFRAAEVTPDHIRRYLAYLKNERQNSASSRNSKLGILKSYYTFLEYYEYQEEGQNPLLYIRRARVPSRLPVYLTQEEAEKILAAAAHSSHPQRDMAILRVMLQTGLRAGELLRLRLCDLDLTDKTLRINGKGSKQRLVPLTKNTMLALQDYLAVRHPGAEGEAQVLFLNDKNKPWEGPELNKCFQELCSVADIQKTGLTVRNLRHTCLTLLLQNGAKLPALKKLAGHSNLSSTQRYIHVTQNQLREAIKKHPLG